MDRQKALKYAAQPMATLVEKYREVRQRKADAKKRYEAAEEVYDEALSTLGLSMQIKMRVDGENSVTTSHGTAYTATSSEATITDWPSLRDFIVQNDAWEILQRRISPSEIAAYMERNPDTPVPGVQLTAKTKIGVRAK